jgi:hypothetical protein
VTRDELNALADRVERATAPDRALDAEIAKAVSLPLIEDHATGALGGTPAYTGSLDAAATLAPEGWWFDLKGVNKRWPVVIYGRDTEEGGNAQQALTSAPALAAAALRARAAEVVE